jgi:putative phosphoesterase
MALVVQLMRIAILADIHGNLTAFEAALEQVQSQQVDHLIIAGDIVLGAPDSAACWRLAESLSCTILRGNHERYVFDYGTPAADSSWATLQYAPLQWSAAQFSEAERQALRQLPLSIRLEDLLIVHASLRNDRDSVTAYTADADLALMFPEVTERYIVRGHNHLCTVRPWREQFIITAGSVGLPLDGNPTAQYLLLEQHATGWHIHHQSVPYDIQATLRRFSETGYLETAGPMARLFLREVLTATPHFVPFLRLYRQWSQQEALTLEAALIRFLES